MYSRLTSWPSGREKVVCETLLVAPRIYTQFCELEEGRIEVHTPKECGQQTPEGEGDREYETI